MVKEMASQGNILNEHELAKVLFFRGVNVFIEDLKEAAEKAQAEKAQAEKAQTDSEFGDAEPEAPEKTTPTKKKKKSKNATTSET